MVGTMIWRATGDGTVVEDLAQETFLRTFRALPYFAVRAKLSTWICTIAHRVAIDHLRKTGRWHDESLTSADIDSSFSDRCDASAPIDPEALAVREETQLLVQEGLAQLPEKYRLPLVYAAIDGLDYETIGEVLGVPTGTAKTLVFRGKRLLRARIEAALTGRLAART
jgi:RNA polymerase sigma-70 factor, ECF subfamily